VIGERALMAVNDTRSDQELLSLLKDGDHFAFNLIHHRYFSLLLRYAYNVLKDRDACMDIIQDVLVWFWENRERHEVNNIRAYLLSAIKYKIANYIRS
jgi:DNA-directed RNA polymerase specialized sigma24 family protein